MLTLDVVMDVIWIVMNVCSVENINSILVLSYYESFFSYDKFRDPTGHMHVLYMLCIGGFTNISAGKTRSQNIYIEQQQRPLKTYRTRNSTARFQDLQLCLNPCSQFLQIFVSQGSETDVNTWRNRCSRWFEYFTSYRRSTQTL